MIQQDENFSEKESLEVISKMIARAKNSYHDRGTLSILWGTVIGICSLLTWAEIHFNLTLPFDVWLLTFVAVVPTIIISVQQGKQRKAKSYDQVAMDYVWTCFGVGVFLIVHANMATFAVVTDLKNQVEQAGLPRPAIYFSDYSSAYLLVMYGIPTLVTAGIKNFKPMLWGGIVCWVSAVLVVYTNREVDMLLMAFSAIMAWLIPGLLLRKKCATKQAIANV